ncbi:WSC domain-containing protein [Mycena pura]|uniref:WSC domain-containing protein n=1 Tax=Mycena pura TaxID=153505 RepID=A0AAD6YIA4_9AGAR|nr:WSC domain-containing protein [Mycena pura]
MFGEVISQMFARLLSTVFALGQVGLALTNPTTVLEYNEWKAIGCQGDSRSARALKHLVAVADHNMTVQSCLDSCGAGGYILGGLEFGDECYCGNAILYVYPSSEACLTPCAGNTSEICGGPDALDLYQFADTPFTTGPPSTLLSYKNWMWWGCMDETFPSDGGRLLPHGPLAPIPAEQMTVERCLDGCEAAGYNAAGLEAGQECFCDLVTVDSSSTQPERWESTITTFCSAPCLANATEVCGGATPFPIDADASTQLSAYLTCDVLHRC